MFPSVTHVVLGERNKNMQKMERGERERGGEREWGDSENREK